MVLYFTSCVCLQYFTLCLAQLNIQCYILLIMAMLSGRKVNTFSALSPLLVLLTDVGSVIGSIPGGPGL